MKLGPLMYHLDTFRYLRRKMRVALKGGRGEEWRVYAQSHEKML